MTFAVRKSLIASTDLFDLEVAAFAKEVRDWLEREAIVRDEDGRTDIEPIDRHHRYPAPSAHPLIVSAVNLDTGLPDYEYVDDTLDQKKAKLELALIALANDAISGLISVPKLQAANLRLADIAADDTERHRVALEKHVGILQKLKLKTIDQEAVGRDVAAMRSDEDNRLIAEMSDKQKKIDAIHRLVIQARSEIEDLTIETVDQYQLPEF